MLRKNDDNRDRRLDPRAVVRWRGEIRTADGALPCSVIDRSLWGARLRVADEGPVPSVFDLMLENRPGVLRARVVWKRWREVGVRLNGRTPGFGRRLRETD